MLRSGDAIDARAQGSIMVTRSSNVTITGNRQVVSPDMFAKGIYVDPRNTSNVVLQGNVEETVNVDDGALSLPVPTVTAPGSGETVGVAGVSFSWTVAPGASGYGLRVWKSSTGETVFSGSVTGGATTSLLALPSGSYRFGVRACVAALRAVADTAPSTSPSA